MKAIEPVAAGFVERDGVKVHWQEFGAGEPTIVLLPTWSIVDSGFWKVAGAVPVPPPSGGDVRRPGQWSFGPARRARRPTRHLEFAADTVAVLDATATEQAVLVGLSCGALWGVQVAADHPARVLGIVASARRFRWRRRTLDRTVHPFAERLETTDGWAKYNRHYWRGRLRGLPRVLLRPDVQRAALDQADRRLRRVGARHRTGEA